MPLKLPPELEARDNAVLRFLAAWDNTATIFGEVLAFQVSYYVADGSVEVREVAQRNSGRDPFPLLLRRSRLPKTLPPVREWHLGGAAGRAGREGRVFGRCLG